MLRASRIFPAAVAAAAAAAATPSSLISDEERRLVNSVQKKLRVRYLIARCPAAVVSVPEFLGLCTSARDTPDAERMTAAEAETFLQTLHDCRVVLRDGEQVFLRPAEVVQKVHTTLGIPPVDWALPKERAEQAALHSELSTARQAVEAAVDKVAVQRKRFWSSVAVGSGAQMTLLSYLTFVAYDWDVMEPACYFVTCATSIVFYLYFLYYRREQSLAQVDESLLPRKLQEALGDTKMKPDVLLRALLQEEEVSKQPTVAPPLPDIAAAFPEETGREWLASQLRSLKPSRPTE